MKQDQNQDQECGQSQNQNQMQGQTGKQSGSEGSKGAVPAGLFPAQGAGVTAARGFKLATAAGGFRPKEPERLDLLLLMPEDQSRPAAAAGVFTRNVFCAAPVAVCREHLGGKGYGYARAVLVNSGTANAATGEQGMASARACAQLVADELNAAATAGNAAGAAATGAAAADAAGDPGSGAPARPQDVLVASTGVIGRQLDLEPFQRCVPGMVLSAERSDEAGHNAARAIMTTDTCPKESAWSWVSADPAYAGRTFTVGGVAKGAGMIMPNMATMIALITTDAPVAPAALHAALQRVVDSSFNKVVVDGDTSTNDSCLLLASGAAAPAGASWVDLGDRTDGADAVNATDSGALYREFEAALDRVATELARAIARDGEGATMLVTVNVAGAASGDDADKAARAVATSPLVKTALFGHDANWGRIAGALGRSGAVFAQENVAISLMGIPVMERGLPLPFDEDEALRRFEAPEITIDINLGAGSAATSIWTCDLTHGYVSINGDYRS